MNSQGGKAGSKTYTIGNFVVDPSATLSRCKAIPHKDPWKMLKIFTDQSMNGRFFIYLDQLVGKYVCVYI